MKTRFSINVHTDGDAHDVVKAGVIYNGTTVWPYVQAGDQSYFWISPDQAEYLYESLRVVLHELRRDGPSISATDEGANNVA